MINTLIHSPLEQFQILPLINFGFGKYDFSITNSSLNLIILCSLISLLLSFINKKLYIIPTNWQLILESLYNFILSIITDQIGTDGKKYFTLLTTIFLLIFFSNFFGMIPYSFTITSHPIITLGLSFSLWLGITILGIIKHGFHFIYLFIPKGIPVAVLPIIIALEILGYLTRPISLGVRLFANMFAGHTLLNIISFFTWNIFIYGGIFSIFAIFPILLIIALIGLEFVICILQAYVFTVLVASYLNDAIHLH